MKEGELIEVGEEYNQFFHRIRGLKGFEYLDENSSPSVFPIEKFKKLLKSGEFVNLLTCQEIIDRVFGHFQWVIHEYVLEVIRINEFQDKPSRFKCLWLCSEGDTEMWKEECAEGYESNIIKVQAEGKIFKADASLLEIEDKPIKELVDNMRLYWEGAQTSSGRKEEILFEGKIKVLKIL
ncbi:DUF2441 domain-containing protein [Candidatus Saccharibacteria bacterium]|nr:DUF2441 domain-containing protein [Candidatus Saccharibacteria bacterium]